MKVHEDIYVTYIPTLAVLPYNTMIYYPKLKSNCVHHCWGIWHHLSSQLPSGLSAGPMFKWRGCRMRIWNQYKKPMEYLNFLDLAVLTC